MIKSMLRALAGACLVFAGAACLAQFNAPPSGTPIKPWQSISTSPTPSVTSVPSIPSPSVSSAIPNSRVRRRFGLKGRSSLLAVPVAVPFYAPVPAYPLLYPMAGSVPGAYGYDDGTAGVAPDDPAVMQAGSAASLDPAPQAATAPANPSTTTTAADPAPEKVSEEETTVLIFQDGHQLEVRNYAIVGHEIYNYTGSGPRKISLTDLDLAATKEANEQRGVDFLIPGSAGGK